MNKTPQENRNENNLINIDSTDLTLGNGRTSMDNYVKLIENLYSDNKRLQRRLEKIRYCLVGKERDNKSKGKLVQTLRKEKKEVASNFRYRISSLTSEINEVKQKLELVQSKQEEPLKNFEVKNINELQDKIKEKNEAHNSIFNFIEFQSRVDSFMESIEGRVERNKTLLQTEIENINKALKEQEAKNEDIFKQLSDQNLSLQKNESTGITLQDRLNSHLTDYQNFTKLYKSSKKSQNDKISLISNTSLSANQNNNRFQLAIEEAVDKLKNLINEKVLVVIKEIIKRIENLENRPRIGNFNDDHKDNI